MSEINVLENSFTKLKNNQYDMTKLTAEELEILQKCAPAIFEACTKFIQEGSKVQERVFNAIDKAIDSFTDQLKNPNLTTEEADKLNDRIERMVDRAVEKDTESKQHQKWLVSGLTAVLGVGLGFWARNKFGKR